MNLKGELSRHRAWLIPLLSLVFVGLGIANLIKHDIVSAEKLTASSDLVSAVSSLVGVIAILFGAVLSYYRFFRGRTFSVRANLRLRVTVVEAGAERRMHSLLLEVENVGTMSIWEPTPVLGIRAHGPNAPADEKVVDWSESLLPDDRVERTAVIDSGEATGFFVVRHFDQTIWAVRYLASVKGRTGDVWRCAMTVPNRAGEYTSSG